MASDAISSYGVQVSYQDADALEPTVIGELRDISGVGLENSFEEVTPHDGTRFREFIATLVEITEITLEINYVPTATDVGDLLGYIITGEKIDIVVTWPDTAGTTWEFVAMVAGFDTGAAVEGALQASLTLRPTGDMTI